MGDSDHVKSSDVNGHDVVGESLKGGNGDG